MTVQLDRVNPKFRQLTDLIFFSDRMDLDLKDFKSLLKENYNLHYTYMWDRLQKCLEIFWENGEQFWSNRFSLLLSLGDSKLAKNLEEYLEKRMYDLIRNKPQVNIFYDIEYLQFVEFCKLKHDRQEDLSNIKDYLLNLPSHSSAEKLVRVVNSFTPFIFNNLNEYAQYLVKRIIQSSRNFDCLLALEKENPYGFHLDRESLSSLAKELLISRAHNDKNRRAFFKLIDDNGIINNLRISYNAMGNSGRYKLLELLESCDYLQIEENHLRNIKNILELDPSLSDNIVEIYAEKLYSRGSGHKKANADRLIRLAKTFPQISPKKILSFLSSNNRMNDIKYVLSSFPDLKKLAAFV